MIESPAVWGKDGEGCGGRRVLLEEPVFVLLTYLNLKDCEVFFPMYPSNITVSVKKTGPVITAALKAQHSPILMSRHSTSCSNMPLPADWCLLLWVLLWSFK